MNVKILLAAAYTAANYNFWAVGAPFSLMIFLPSVSRKK